MGGHYLQREDGLGSFVRLQLQGPRLQGRIREFRLQHRIGQMLAFLEQRDEEGLRRFLGRARELRDSLPD